MIVKQLAGQTQTITLEGLEKPKNLLFQDFHPSTKISVEIQRVGEDNIKIYVPILITSAHELAQKVLAVATGSTVVPLHLDRVNNNTIVRTAILPIAIGGEVPLGVNDKVIVKLTEMGNVNGVMRVQGGSKESSNYFKVLDQNFDGRGLEKRISVETFDFLVFQNDADKFPELIERFYETENLRDTKEDLNLLDSNLFGVVAHKKTPINADIDSYEPIFGALNVIVVDVRELTTLTLKDERRNEYNFFALKLS